MPPASTDASPPLVSHETKCTLRAVWLGLLERLQNPTTGSNGQKRSPLWQTALALACFFILAGPVVGVLAPAGVGALSKLSPEHLAYVEPFASSAVAMLVTWLTFRQLRRVQNGIQDCCSRGQRILAERSASQDTR